MTTEKRALTFIDQFKDGVLGTLLEGHPYGSIVPYIHYDNKIIIYISNISQHFKNIVKDSRVSLTIYDNQIENVQANPRISIIGTAAIIKEDYLDQDLYFKVFPNSKKFSTSHGFYFCEIKMEKAHFIEGFGKINWINFN